MSRMKCSKSPVYGVVSLLLAVVMTIAAQPVAAQQQQPSMFSKVAEKANPTNWKMPSFRLPSFLVPNDEQERIVTRKNSLVQDIKDTTARSWQRTKQTFSPARLNPMNMFAGSRDSNTTPNSPEKPGFFSSLLSPPDKQPVERVATVNEFLGQERP